MNALTPPPDQTARERAIDPSRSCIVQAPAGAGKTTLLAHRYLRLLAAAARPEEVLAITFTIKAAAEMKQRVMELLTVSGPLADPVLKRAQERGWQLLDNPNLLKIQTIDSFALDIARRATGTHNLAGYDIVEDAELFYINAAERLLNRLTLHNDPTADIVADFLAFLDNDADKLTRLVSTMLGKRDQWLALVRTISQPGNEVQMGEILAATIGQIRAVEEQALHTKLTATDTTWLNSLSLEADDWRGLLNNLMTTAGTLRKKIPTDLVVDKAQRKLANQWLASLHERGLATILERYVKLPDHSGFNVDTQLLQTCCLSLALAALELDNLFKRDGITDFTGLLLSAKHALRDESGNVTDLALLLDYRIKHILIDEFQDTSRGQLELFEMLLEPWQPQDANSFFAVGDPMQSIYRFRDAEVQIFAEAKTQGIASIPLENCDLEANFRSDPVIVDWVNTLWGSHISGSRQNDIEYFPATAMQPPNPAAKVVCNYFTSSQHEVNACVAHVEQLLKEFASLPPTRTENPPQAAILCRSRNHLIELLHTLEERNIQWQATDIDLLQKAPIVIDLLAGLQLLVQPMVQKSWFSVLRSPMFGAPLDDLLDLAEPSVLENLRTSDKAYQQRLCHAYTWAESTLHELPIREVLEGFWVRCGGPDAYADAELQDALMFFELLESISPDRFNLQQVEHDMARLFAQSQSNAQLHVLTIHKAKGLEFDHVIVPRLEKSTRSDTPNLLLWKLTNAGLILGLKGDSTHTWLNAEDRQNARAEEQRLLYVACTRAKTTLHLSYVVNQERRPGGLANYLHDVAAEAPATQPIARIKQTQRDGAINQPDLFPSPPLLRLPKNYRWIPPAATPLTYREQRAMEPESISDQFAVAKGNLIHRVLDFCARSKRTKLSADELATLLNCWRPASDPQLITRVTAEVMGFMDTDLGQWVLSPHPHHESEASYQYIESGEVATVVIDRMFVDQGTRWIIDYKTSEQAHERTDELRARYRPQLERYAKVIQTLYPEPIQTALLFVDPPKLERLEIETP